MLIFEDPLKLLYIALGILLFFLTIFKISDFFGSLKVKEKSKKNSQKEETSKSEDKKSESSESKNESVVEKTASEDVAFDSKNMTNYLYDRFVTNPTIDDSLRDTSKLSEAFLTDESYTEIRDKKVEIKVEPINSTNSYRENVYKKIQELTNNNRSEKERMLEEFNNLPKEMKLLLIENIIQKID